MTFDENDKKRHDDKSEPTDHQEEVTPSYRPFEPPSDGASQPSPPWKGSDILKGFGLVVLLHLIWFIYPITFIGIGLLQLLYVIPIIVINRNNKGMMQGALIAAGITFLLNSACYGIIFLNF